MNGFEESEKNYIDIISSLGKLKKVNAPDEFNRDLMRRINSENYKNERNSFWQEFLMPSKLIPAAALAAVLIFLIIIKFNSPQPADPLLAQPRLREDILKSNRLDSVREKMNYSHLKSNTSGGKKSRYPVPNSNYPWLTGSVIKTGLNFKQANITKSQRQEVSAIKKKFESLLKNQVNNNKPKY